MRTVTMLELRLRAEAVVADLRRGVTLILTYRGRPLARLEPIRSAPEDLGADDPLFTLAEQAAIAEDPTLAGGNAALSNADIDRTLYGGA